MDLRKHTTWAGSLIFEGQRMQAHKSFFAWRAINPALSLDLNSVNVFKGLLTISRPLSLCNPHLRSYKDSPLSVGSNSLLSTWNRNWGALKRSGWHSGKGHRCISAHVGMFSLVKTLSVWIIHGPEVIKSSWSSCPSGKISSVSWEPSNIYFLMFTILESLLLELWSRLFLTSDHHYSPPCSRHLSVWLHNSSHERWSLFPHPLGLGGPWNSIWTGECGWSSLLFSQKPALCE